MIQLGRLSGLVTIADSGLTGTDRATVNGTNANQRFTVSNNVTNGAAQTGGFVNTESFGQRVNYTQSLEALTVRGQAGSDFFKVQPSQTAAITIDGGPIAKGDLDSLQFDSFGLPVTRTGSTLQASGGRPKAFLPVQVQNIDITPPTATVKALPAITTTKVITLTIAISDGSVVSGQPVSGVATYDVYVSVDSGPWARFATKIPASQTQVKFLASSNHKYAFRAVATDAAGNVETEPATPVAEATTRTQDVDSPITRVTAVTPNTKTGLFEVGITGSDAGGSGLHYIKVYVSVDGGAVREISGSPITLKPNTDPTKPYTGSLTYNGIRDGVDHSYRFYTLGTDYQGNVEVTGEAPKGILVHQKFSRK